MTITLKVFTLAQYFEIGDYYDVFIVIRKLSHDMIHSTGKLFLTAFFMLFMLVSTTVVAQQNPLVTLNTTSEALIPEQNFQLDIKVTNFDSILGVQFSVNWDPLVLSFVSVENFGLEDVSLANNFGLMHTADGKLSFLWYDTNLGGITLDAASTLFSVVFKVVGNVDETAAVAITSDPTVVEFSNTSAVLDPSFENFEMLIGPLASIYNSAPELIQVENIYPNPIENKSQVDFKLAHSTDLDFFIFDESGKMVLHTREYFTTGSHSFFLNGEYFPASGKYLLKMVSEEFEVQQKLVFIGK